MRPTRPSNRGDLAATGVLALLAPAITAAGATAKTRPSSEAAPAGGAVVGGAATRPAPGDAKALEPTVVTATRSRTPISKLTRSVTVIDREEIERQSVISRDIGDILGKTVPGLGTSTESLSNFSQTLRGRKFLTLVDGVPISTPLRDGARDLKIIDPESLERVEVLRGGTATYGFGATGGIVHFITRDPDQEGVRGYSEAGLRFNTEHPDGSVAWHTSHGASGQLGAFDFVLNASGGQRNRFFDADGDRIPPEPLASQGGLADTNEWNILGKFGFDFDGGAQRLELTVNNYDIEQDTEFVTRSGDFSQREKAVGVRGQPAGKRPGTESELVSLSYTHRDVLGSRVKLQAYHLDYLARFASFFNIQSELTSERIGARLTIETPLTNRDNGPKITWGTDFLNERTAQFVFRGNFPSTPEMEQNALAGFAELTWPVGDIGRIRGGVRHESFDLEVADYTNVAGGTLTYDETLFNVTAVAYLTDAIELFGGFSQGFAPSEVGRVLRRRAGSGGSVEQIDPAAKKVDNYEAGLRADWGAARGAVTGFFSESELGTTFNSSLQVRRQPEEIWGVESSFELEPAERWTLGGTATWIASRTDGDGDGELDEELPNTRVPPFKLTAFAAYRPFEGWRNRLQVLYSGNRTPDSNAFGSAPVNAFTVVDFQSSVSVGPGELRLGVENLLNEDYFPVAAQAFGGDSTFSAGQGRTVSLSYRVDW